MRIARNGCCKALYRHRFTRLDNSANATNATASNYEFNSTGDYPWIDDYENSNWFVTPGKQGDVNGDGFVDVTDVSILINYVLGKDYDVFYLEQANLDSDPTKVDVGDVSVLIGMVLGK